MRTTDTKKEQEAKKYRIINRINESTKLDTRNSKPGIHAAGTLTGTAF